MGAGDGLGGEDGDVLLDDALALLFGGVVADAAKDAVGDVLHAHQPGGGEALAGDFLLAGHGPETVGEVVVLHGAVAGDVVVAAVVVGEEEALVGDELAGAALVEEDDGILEAGVVDVIDVLGGDAHAGLLHGCLVAAQEHGNPHALVGHGGRQQEGDHCNDGKDFFHVIRFVR